MASKDDRLTKYNLQELSQAEFKSLVYSLLPTLLGVSDVDREPRIAPSLYPDFIAENTGGDVIIGEVRNLAPNTEVRLSAIVEQLHNYRDAYRNRHPDDEVPFLALITSDALSSIRIDYLQREGIDYIAHGPSINKALDIDAKVRLAWLKRLRSSPADNLLGRLAETNPGRSDWVKYQRLVGEILEFLFTPPLGRPISERANFTSTNRRDFILSNYRPHEFWDYLRAHYEAHYVVVDAKNLVRKIRKQEILQLANYLSGHGAGLFGVIFARNSGDQSAIITQREQWVHSRKLIIIVDDSDVQQMIALRSAGGDPSDLVRQKIEDFRLAF